MNLKRPGNFIGTIYNYFLFNYPENALFIYNQL